MSGELVVERSPKTQPLVKGGSLRVLGAKTEYIEMSRRPMDDLFHQLPAHTVAAPAGQDIQMADATDPVGGGIRVDVQPADAEESGIKRCGEQNLTGTVKAVGPRLPFVDQASDKPEPSPFALVNELGQPIYR